MDNEWTYLEISLVVIIAVMFISLLWVMRISRKVSKLRRNYMTMMESTGVANLEDVILELQMSLKELGLKMEQQDERISCIERKLPKLKTKMAMSRYNAFNEGGSALSFSIAIIDEEKDGAVISSIHSRDYAYVYAKPLENGQSPYPLTPEEQQVIQEAK